MPRLAFIARWLSLALVCACCRSVFAAAPDYATEIAPVFTRYCAGCHNAEDREGKLVLERFADLIQGGEHGPAIVPGKSAESRLIRVLTGQAEPAMPPDDEPKPSPAEIALLAAWIDSGAIGPAEGSEVGGPTVPQIAPRRAVVEPVAALAVSPQGDLLAVARYRRVEILRRGDRAVLQTLSGIRGRITWLAFHPDGATLWAAAGEPGAFGEVGQWRVADGALLRTLTGHRDSLNGAALSADGALLATASYDQTIKLWDLATGRELHTMAGHNDAVYDLAFRGDGRVLASASGDRTVKLWDVAQGSRLETLSQSLKELYALAFSPDGQRLIAGGVDGRLRAWQITADAKENSNRLVINRAAHDAPIVRLAWSRSGGLLASASEDRRIKLWEPSTLVLRGTLEDQPAAPTAIEFAPDGATLFVGRQDGSLAEYPLGGLAAVGNEATPLEQFEALVDYGDQPPIDQLPEIAEVEPNDAPVQANSLAAPGRAKGVIKRAGNAPDADLFRFEARRGEHWIVETNAARSGSKLDSRIEILHADGRPVERVLLRAVRDSELEFRSEDSSDRGLRLANWDELPLDALVYLEGEVIKHYRQRRGPDDDAQFYPEGGARFTYFDTSPRAHALAAKCYFVEPYPPGTPLAYNGLPVFNLAYENDDDGERKLGADSRVNFTAPEDGTYLARVTDIRGFDGDDYRYELVVRRPQPGYAPSLQDPATSIPAGSGKRIKVFVDRSDGFWGEVRVDVTDLPPGFYATTPIVVAAGQRDAQGVLFAHPLAQPPSEAAATAAKLIATATIGGKPVVRPVAGWGRFEVTPKPKILVRLAVPGEGPRLPSGDATSPVFPQPAELTIAPGTTITCQLSVERNDFGGIINFEADNLPHGVIVDNIGLNGIQLLEGETERTLYLSAESWVPEQDRLFQLFAKEEGIQVSLPLVLRVRRPAGQPAVASAAGE